MPELISSIRTLLNALHLDLHIPLQRHVRVNPFDRRAESAERLTEERHADISPVVRVSLWNAQFVVGAFPVELQLGDDFIVGGRSDQNVRHIDDCLGVDRYAESVNARLRPLMELDGDPLNQRSITTSS